MTTFRAKLETLLNEHSQENGSNTPDFVLADFLCNCLRSFDSAVNQRERFHDRDPGVRAPLQPAAMELGTMTSGRTVAQAAAAQPARGAMR